MSVHTTSFHFTSLRLFTLNPTSNPLLVTTFLTLFPNVFSLQGKDTSKLVGNLVPAFIGPIYEEIFTNICSSFPSPNLKLLFPDAKQYI
jgi:hypothetical protein